MMPKGEQSPGLVKEKDPRRPYGAAGNLRAEGSPVILTLAERPDDAYALLKEISHDTLLDCTENLDDILAEPLADTGSQHLADDELLVIWSMQDTNSKNNKLRAKIIRNALDCKGEKQITVVIKAKFEKVKPFIKLEDLIKQ